MNGRRRTVAGLLLVLLVFVLGCAGPEEKRQQYFKQGQGNFEQGEYEKAFLDFRNAVKADPEFADGYYMAGRAALGKNDSQQAYKFLQNAVTKDPGHVGANIELGRLLLLGREYDEARKRAEAALAREPDNSDALLLKATLLLAAVLCGTWLWWTHRQPPQPPIARQVKIVRYRAYFTAAFW